MEALIRDARHALRLLAKTPGFTAVALATLALCLGANLTIFAVVDAVLLRPLPFRQSDRLVSVFNSYPRAGVERSSASIPNYYDRRHAIKAFSSVSIYQESSVVVGESGSPERVPDARISPEFFRTLGVPLARGQPFTDANLVYSNDQLAILTNEFWREHFHSDPSVLGRKFLNDGLSITVVGVLPPKFHFLGIKAQFFRPASHDEKNDTSPRNRHSNNWNMIARLAPGVTVAQAQAEIDAFNAQQLRDDPFAALVRNSGYHTVICGLHDDFVRSARPILLLLQGFVLLLLVIGSVNLINLLLVRASGRTKEVAVRQALGASSLQLAREAGTGSILLALAGGALGLGLGALGIRLLALLGTDRLPLGARLGLDGRLAVAALVESLAVGILLALPLIWFMRSANLASVLQTESRSGTTTRSAQRLRHAFVVLQVALAFVLLCGAGLLGLSFQRVLRTPVGFNPGQVLTGNLTLPWKNYRDGADRAAFVARLLPAIRALPGVADAAITTYLPFNGGGNDSVVTVDGYVRQRGESIQTHYLADVEGDYWKLMRIPLLRGRVLEDADRAQKVCVIDEAVARRYWPRGDAIGHILAPSVSVSSKNGYRIVGVVGEVKQNDLAEKGGHGAVYFPYRAFNAPYFALVVRSLLPVSAVAPSVQKAVLRLDPQLPIDNLRAMTVKVEDTLVARRSPAILAGIFAVVALLLASIGTYGVLSYSVTQRRREIGIRMALGALPEQIRNQFVSMGLRVLVVGAAAGTLGAWIAGHAMQAMLFDVAPLPPPILGLTVVVMAIVTLSASVLPTRRATQVNPVVALRAE